MDAHILEFFSLLLRWVHAIAGIAWIGASFYFIWLDNSIEPTPPGSEAARKGVAGELWAVHGGGCYNPQEYAVAPPSLPEKLHWFKWEAYTTWLSGTALLVLLYWMRAQVMMVEPSLMVLTPWQAVGIGLASMVGSWIIYDALCRSPLGKHDAVLGVIIFGFLVALSWCLGRVFGGRAMFIHVGTSIGTIMVANVAMIIIPGQRRMVEAMRAGQLPDPADDKRAKQRSVHNNYLTLPVLFINDQQPLRLHFRAPTRVGDPRVDGGGGGEHPALFQPASQGCARMALPRDRRGVARRGCVVDHAAAPAATEGGRPRDLRPGARDPRPTLRDMPFPGADFPRPDAAAGRLGPHVDGCD
jgi:uncharacterized membrane protein